MRMALVDPSGIVVGLLDWDTAQTFTPPPGHVLRPAGDARVGDFGVIPNAALTNPVIPAVVNSSVSNMTLTAAGGEVIGVNLTVPAGCTRLLANATGHLSASSTSGTSSILLGQVSLGSVLGDSFFTQLPLSGVWTMVSGPFVTLAEGLTPGSTTRLSLHAETPPADVVANSFNGARLTATLLWLR